MNYNFNAQFPFPWTTGNPYMANGLHPHPSSIPPSGGQSGFNIAQPGGATPNPGFCAPLLPGVRYLGAMYPYGMSGSFQSGTFPANWNFNYNTDVNHFNAIQSHNAIQSLQEGQNQQSGQLVVSTPVVHKQSQNEAQKPMENDSGSLNVGDTTNSDKQSNVADDIAEKVSNLLHSDPNILKSALSKLSASSASVQNIDKQSPRAMSTVHLSSSSNSVQDQLSKYSSDTDTSLELEASDFTSTVTEIDVIEQVLQSDGDVMNQSVQKNVR